MLTVPQEWICVSIFVQVRSIVRIWVLTILWVCLPIFIWIVRLWWPFLLKSLWDFFVLGQPFLLCTSMTWGCLLLKMLILIQLVWDPAFLMGFRGWAYSWSPDQILRGKILDPTDYRWTEILNRHFCLRNKWLPLGHVLKYIVILESWAVEEPEMSSLSCFPYVPFLNTDYSSRIREA